MSKNLIFYTIYKYTVLKGDERGYIRTVTEIMSNCLGSFIRCCTISKDMI